MVTNFLDLVAQKKQSLEGWVTTVMMPITSAIGAVSEQLEALYQELM